MNTDRDLKIRALLVVAGVKWLEGAGYTLEPPPGIEFRGHDFKVDVYGRKVDSRGNVSEEVAVACETSDSVEEPGALVRAKALSRWTMGGPVPRTILLCLPTEQVDANFEQTEPEDLKLSSGRSSHRLRATIGSLLSYYDDCIRA